MYRLHWQDIAKKKRPVDICKYFLYLCFHCAAPFQCHAITLKQIKTKLVPRVATDDWDPAVSRLLRSFTAHLLHKIMFLFKLLHEIDHRFAANDSNSTCNYSHTKPNRQIIGRLTILMWEHMSVLYVHIDLDQVGPVVCVCACNGMLISLIRQWVKQFGWDYWPACQPRWPLLWRPLKRCSLLMPETLTASFISATPSASLAASTVVHPAIINHLD